MRDSIYTIPINEVFEPKCGCPICQMRDTLEERSVEYIMGAAMMEPDVRMETNKKGFCSFHFNQMLRRKNRLSLALILESRLMEITEHGLEPGQPAESGGLFRKKEAVKVQNSCFVCDKIAWAQQRMYATTIQMYNQSEEFRTLYKEQEYLCLVHYKELTAVALGTRMDKKLQKQFLEDSKKLCTNYLDEVQKDVSHYCKMFDYRNNGADADWGNSRDSIERAIYFLTSRPTE